MEYWDELKKIKHKLTDDNLSNNERQYLNLKMLATKIYYNSYH